MADHFKSPNGSHGTVRARPFARWWKEILLGFGIGALLMGVVIAAIFLVRAGLLPTWIFGWISDDRRIQEHQFRLALSGLLAIWVGTRLIKHGVFGGYARTSYNDLLAKLKVVQSKPEDEGHDRVCALKNVRIAAFLAGLFALEAFQSWRELGKPFVEHSLYDLLFRIVLMSIVFPVFFRMTKCVPERFIFGIVTVRFVTGFIFEYAPNIADPIPDLVREGTLLLWIFALITSLGLLVSSLSKPRLSE